MICGTCGRDNPNNLVFCQDCGARLGPRIAPPTPLIGMSSHVPSSQSANQANQASQFGLNEAQGPDRPLDSFPLPDENSLDLPDAPIDDIDALLNNRVSEPPKESRSRPSAPNFDFAPRENQNEKNEEPTTNRCIRCGNTNAPHIRYCLSCGNKLRGSQAPAADSAAPKSVPPQLMSTAAANPPAPQAPIASSPRAADQPIAPLPVYGVGNVAAATSTIRICTRCRGVCDSTAQFCKFCGASLVDIAVSQRPLSDHPPAPRPDLSRVSAAREFAVQEAPVISSRPAPPRISHDAPAASRAPAAPGAATAQVRGRLIVIAKDGGEGASYPFADRLDIGRVEGDVIVPDDPYISPRHARLSFKGKMLLRDLGSVNGVYLRLAPQASTNGTAKDPAKASGLGAGSEGSSDRASVAMKLQDQDLILLGQQVIRFEVVRDAEEGLGPASQHGTLVFGTPAAPRYARLCLRTVEGVTRDVYYLGKRETILGRESGDIIFAEDPFLSRRHASIVVQETGKNRVFALSDFGSSNGTFLQIRGEVPLESGAEFRVGQQLFRVELNA